MSSNSESWSSKSVSVRCGFPSVSECGREVQKFTSKTPENPGRLFFRCASKLDDHLFKWIEESVLEEVEDSKPKLRYVESELLKVNAEIENLKFEVEATTVIKNELEKTKKVVKMLIVCVFVPAVFIALGFFLSNVNTKSSMLSIE